jgi:transcriptional regulator with XRE-family HTH domain
LKQSEVAEKSGLSRPSIGNYESGKRVPNVEALSKIAEALNVSVYELIIDSKAGYLIDGFTTSEEAVKMSNIIYERREAQRKEINDIKAMKCFYEMLELLDYMPEEFEQHDNFLYRKMKDLLKLEVNSFRELRDN